MLAASDLPGDQIDVVAILIASAPRIVYMSRFGHVANRKLDRTGKTFFPPSLFVDM